MLKRKHKKHTNIIGVSLKTLFFPPTDTSGGCPTSVCDCDPELLPLPSLGVQENQDQPCCGALEKLNITFKINYILYVLCANITVLSFVQLLAIHFFLNRLITIDSTKQ